MQEITGPVKGQAYTRKKYAKGFPPPKIVKFTMGDTKANFEIEAQLIALKRTQIRHMALEAARVATNRVLMDKLINDYYMQVLPYPHIILRENKMIFGAHADTTSTRNAKVVRKRNWHCCPNRTWPDTHNCESQGHCSGDRQRIFETRKRKTSNPMQNSSNEN